MSAVQMVTAERRSVGVRLWSPVEHLRHRRSLPGLHPPVDVDAMLVVFPMVGPFRVVRDGVTGQSWFCGLAPEIPRRVIR